MSDNVIERPGIPALVGQARQHLSNVRQMLTGLAAQVEYLRAIAPTQWYQPAERLPDAHATVVGSYPDRSRAVYFDGVQWFDVESKTGVPDPELWCYLPTLAQPNLRPDWNKAPVSAVAWAVDFDGKAFWYFDIPTQGFACWQTTQQRVPAGQVDRTNIHFNWRRTLSARRDL